MGCPDTRAREKVKIPPEVAKAYWAAAKELHASGVKDYATIAKTLADKAGVSPEFVHKALNSNKSTRVITDAMWREQAAHQGLLRSARDSMRQANTPGWQKAVGKVYNAPRTGLTFAHSLAFPFTHAKDLAFTDPEIFTKLNHNTYKFASNEGLWKSEMEALQLRSSYREAVSHGVGVKPGLAPTSILPKDVNTSTGGKPPGFRRIFSQGASRRSFDALKVARLDLWDKWTRDIKDAPKEVLDEMAKMVNHATSEVKLPGSAGLWDKLAFSAKVFASKKMMAYVDPVKYLFKDGSLTQAERSALNVGLKRWAKIAVASTGLSVASNIFRQYSAGEKVDWQNPDTYMKMNVAGLKFAPSALSQVVSIPVHAAMHLWAGKLDDAGLDFLKDVLGAANPMLRFGMTLATGRKYILGGPRTATPGIPQIANKVKTGQFESKRGETLPRQTAAEQAAETFAPMPAGSAIQTLYESLRREGATPAIAKSILAGFGTSFGMHSYVAQGKKEKISPAQKKENEKFRLY